MAASVVVEESEVVTSLSHSLRISKDVLAQIANQSEDAASVLDRVKAVFDEYVSSEEKYRLDMANLRRARVNAGLSFFVFAQLLEVVPFILIVRTKKALRGLMVEIPLSYLFQSFEDSEF